MLGGGCRLRADTARGGAPTASAHRCHHSQGPASARRWARFPRIRSYVGGVHERRVGRSAGRRRLRRGLARARPYRCGSARSSYWSHWSCAGPCCSASAAPSWPAASRRRPGRGRADRARRRSRASSPSSTIRRPSLERSGSRCGPSADRYEAWARGSAAGATLDRAQAGERLELSGRLTPGAGSTSGGAWRSSTSSGQLQVDRAEAYDGGDVARPRRQPHPAHAGRRRVAAVAGRTGLVHGLRAGRRSGRATRPRRRLPGVGPESLDGRVRRKIFRSRWRWPVRSCGASAFAPATSPRWPSWHGSRC